MMKTFLLQRRIGSGQTIRNVAKGWHPVRCAASTTAATQHSTSDENLQQVSRTSASPNPAHIAPPKHHDSISSNEQDAIARSGQTDSRLARLRASNTKPFSAFLTDRFQRQHTYLRISLTERCNLRCTYCMPAEGVPLSASDTQLTTPEVLMLAETFVRQGVNKIRLTGGEPTVRRDFVPLMQELGSLKAQGLRELCITSNGIALRGKLDKIAEAGLTGVNLSLDTLEPGMFEIMTRRKGFDKVLATMEQILQMNRLGAGIKLKINIVLMRNVNEREILPFVELGREKDLEVRFIEYMPFDGNRWAKEKMVPYGEIVSTIRERYPAFQRLPDPSANETSKTWQVPGFRGRVGFITSMTENFCGTCNRLRITSDGNLKVCLFGQSEVSLRDIVRKANGGQPIDEATFKAWRQELVDHGGDIDSGHGQREQELLNVIGKAVGRKRARHAGMGTLENMKNRPMILIDDMRLSRYLSNPFMGPTGYAMMRRPTMSLSLPKRQARRFTSASPLHKDPESSSTGPKVLPHLDSTSAVHMVDVSSKTESTRSATAIGYVRFSDHSVGPLIESASLKKGDVLAVARVAGIMAAKRTPELVPLCHPGIAIEGLECRVELVDRLDRASSNPNNSNNQTHDRDAVAQLAATKAWENRLEGYLAKSIGQHGGIRIAATVTCSGKTGVEMEALCAVAGAGLSILDMVKSVDRGASLEAIRNVFKTGGRSGTWIAPAWEDEREP